MTFQHKLACLKRKIYGYKSCVVAFSGGQDSALLLKLCWLVLPKTNILAVTAVSATYPKDELRKAKILAKEIGVKLRVIKTAELGNKKFTANSVSRCYFCKKELFLKLTGIARNENFDFVLDASNVSDKLDYRPGNAAKKELGIRSPLLEAGFNKKDIRKLSKMLGLPSWNKPPLACLASRIPYGTKITAGLLKRIDQAEAYLVSLGFRVVRLRHYNGLCRIEVEMKCIKRLLRKRQAIVDKLKSLGYNYITLDLEGYRTGSLNEVIKK
ncbi:MAG: ATP-dependent sacrificial sulfur transferase LarE [Candidatus Omnitrophica bacterium]|nr:ATP-dependent sacrificial sulfur transferase LarE [Candidatus Omnitrophota bacterium]